MTDSQLLTEAFRTIASIIRDFEVRGRVCRGATLKPEYLRRAPLLTEQSLGFRTFGELLRAADAAGYIRVSARRGADLEVSLPETPEPCSAALKPQPLLDRTSGPSLTGKTGPVEVRPDLWRAFNSNSATYSYDRERDLAVLASEVAASDSSLVPIPSLTTKATGWMSEFVSVHEKELGPDLARTVSAAHNRYEFATLLRSNPALSRRWRADYLSKVVAEIEAWAVQHNVTPRGVVRSFRGGSRRSLPDERVPAPRIAPPSHAAIQQCSVREELDRRCATLLDTLINELLQLRGLLSVAQEKHS